jgi:hypothetical protein
VAPSPASGDEPHQRTAGELEIIAVEVQPADGGQHYRLVIHVMPTRLRGDSP